MSITKFMGSVASSVKENGVKQTLWALIRSRDAFIEKRGRTLVGVDSFGNRYYQSEEKELSGRDRWVEYADEADPSQVSSQWHGWLHNTVDIPPTSAAFPEGAKYAASFEANATGTEKKYLNPGHLLRPGMHAYGWNKQQSQAWQPPSSEEKK